MKKIFNLVFFVIAITLFFTYYNYINQSFNYHTAQFIGYLLIWSITIFLTSLIGFVLDNDKYKRWFFITILYFIGAIIVAYIIGDGNGGIVSIDGKSMTWFLAGLYSLISIIYFIVSYFKNRKSV